MNKKGFYIKSIIATGDGMKTSKVEFQDGCNLLFGPSDKGKSSVFSIIDYMLGAGSEPNEVKESYGYTDYYLEFVTYEDTALHTAHRLLGDNVVIVEDCSFDLFGTGASKPITYSIRNNGQNPYSKYLLNLNGYSQNLQLKKSSTKKTDMSFALARQLFLVSEDRVVSKQPIFIPDKQYTEQTQQKSFLYYITSGQDDSAFQEGEDEKIRKSRYGGMILLAKESLDNVNAKILGLGDVSFADFKGEEFFEVHKEQIKQQEEILKELFAQRATNEDVHRRLLSQLLFANEFVNRMTLLQRHYILDLQRYEHLYEGLSLMMPLTEEHLCPVCQSHIVNDELLNADSKEALKTEYDRTKLKLADINKVLAAKNEEIKEIKSKISDNEASTRVIVEKINGFEPQIKDLKATLLKYQENIEKKAYSTFLQAEAQRLNKQIDDLQKQQKERPDNSNYNRSASIGHEFCESIKSKLENWNVIGDVPVVYEDTEFDFNIGGQKRIMCGKGSRGVTCTAILMTLIEFCKQEEIPFSQLLVIDSPLTAHFDDETVDADETTQSKFFNYCNETDFDYQLILIDNKAPSSEERNEMNGIHFIEFSQSSRNGFYLGKKEV